jgi:hypothetical protein
MIRALPLNIPEGTEKKHEKYPSGQPTSETVTHEHEEKLPTINFIVLLRG